ncbi:hypothetical protein MBLNU457_6115t1 [Dothideomycetes sp. NU457]
MPEMDIFSEDYARQKDEQDPLKNFREQFIIPTPGQLKRKTLKGGGEPLKQGDVEASTYLCGNSLGLQPKLTAQYTAMYHETWATKGVYGHFKEIEDSPLVPWLHVDDDAVKDMAAVVGAREEEVSVMQTLTANLHFAMATFYRPNSTRHKIILESKAFPSDHYAIQSQMHHHNIDPAKAMITIEPTTPTKPTLSTSQILSVIDEHASSTALLLLPAVQFYTGQYFDIATITAHAQKLGIVVGWDCAHAVGNVDLQLHEWNVDFAVWCNYKYMNCGPGSIGGLFIHNRHSSVQSATDNAPAEFRHRLAGWWGSSKSSRFSMTNVFEPIPGAAGWQLSNPSVADLTAVRASLDVFKETSMAELRKKSLLQTGYLEQLLDRLAEEDEKSGSRNFEIITPREQDERGAQLSVRLSPGLLEGVLVVLEEEGVVVDERKPDVIRVAPAPLYNTFADVLRFAQVFGGACRRCRKEKQAGGGSLMEKGGQGEKGWSEVK